MRQAIGSSLDPWQRGSKWQRQHKAHLRAWEDVFVEAFGDDWKCKILDHECQLEFANLQVSVCAKWGVSFPEK